MERHRRSIDAPRPEVPASEQAAHRVAAFLAEAVGTFALTLVAAGAEMVARMGLAGPDHLAGAVAPGLLVAAFIYALGDASGAHFNPAVTLAFALKGLFPWRWVPGYWLGQLAGAILAAVVLRVILGDVGALGASTPHVSPAAAVALEVLLTWTLVTVILGTADRYRLVGQNAALAVGATIALCGLWAGPLDGASMNPARSLGPAIVGGSLSDAWIYVVGPVIGAGLAVLTTLVLHGSEAHDRKPREAAQGERQAGDGDQGRERRPTRRSRPRSGAEA
jgi:aquaporin Z